MSNQELCTFPKKCSTHGTLWLQYMHVYVLCNLKFSNWHGTYICTHTNVDIQYACTVIHWIGLFTSLLLCSKFYVYMDVQGTFHYADWTVQVNIGMCISVMRAVCCHANNIHPIRSKDTWCLRFVIWYGVVFSCHLAHLGLPVSSI